MKTILIVGPLVAGIVILLYTIIANLLRVWLDHRIKMALLEKLQNDPHSSMTPAEAQALLEASSREPVHHSPVDYVVVGAVLSVVGLCSATGGYFWGQGVTSVGVYFGGVACVVVGVILMLLGIVIRYLSRLPIDTNLP